MKVYLAISLGMHRTSCKFLTILLEVFTILATKGFCIPPELQEEAAKADGTKFEDIESGGFGEGEGTKDASGNIEHEDQLDDANELDQGKKEKEPKDKDLKDEEQGIEMSNDFEGKLHGGEGAEDSDDEDENEEEESQDLDKQMGDVEADEAGKLDDKVWGDDSENEEDLREDEESGGVADNAPAELAAKDKHLEDDIEKGGEKENEKGNQPQEPEMDETNEEYTGEKPDPMINAPPTQEPEIEELPENMEITDEVGGDDPGENPEEMDEPADTLEEPKDEQDTENKENEEADNADGDNKAQDPEGESEDKGQNVTDQHEPDEPTDESNMEIEERALPTQTPTTQEQALPSDMKQSSTDPVISEEPMDWENGAQNANEQHKQGLSDAKDMPSDDPGHEGKKTSGMRREAIELQNARKMKQPGEKRTVDESNEEDVVKKCPIMERKDDKTLETNQDGGKTAEMYEHVSKEEESSARAIDIATKEQAEIRTAQNENQDDEEMEDEQEIIQLSSGDEDDEPCNKAVGETLKHGLNQKAGHSDNAPKENVDIPKGELIPTQSVARGGESTIHTQNELWKSLSSRNVPQGQVKSTTNVNVTVMDKNVSISDELWRQHELSVSNLSQELCEQLRLVLEPTKMSKFKGDYRTGKRLNMRKIIPYIASQFRKDKIWLRRTKPSKRQYQIMLAMDDSSSMADNKSKQLAFESLAVLGQSLSLLEAGELSVVSFGENVQLLHGFQDQFSATAGARIMEQMTFAQKGTKIAQLLNFATDAMIQARNSSRSTASKETAQLLVIISDGRNIFFEGEKKVVAAVKNARDNNVFMVFLILDNPDGNHSILDIMYPIFEGEDVTMISYMDKFPFPFYIILRQITALPQVLGEALRQWFELVTSVDR